MILRQFTEQELLKIKQHSYTNHVPSTQKQVRIFPTFRSVLRNITLTLLNGYSSLVLATIVVIAYVICL